MSRINNNGKYRNQEHHYQREPNKGACLLIIALAGLIVFALLGYAVNAAFGIF